MHMKRVVVFFAALALLCAPAQAQGILGRIAGAAGRAVGNVVGNAVGNAVNDKVSEKAGELLPDGVKDLSDLGGDFTPITGEQAFPPRRYSTFGWDGVVTPSSAQFPVPLMNEFPAVPAAADLVNPVEEKQIAYYQAIKRVTLRAEELNADTTCDDEATLAWREKINSELKNILGLSDEDIAMMEREDLTDAENEYLSEKIAKALFGDDVDMAELERQAAEMEGMSTNEMIADTYSKTEIAVFAVYDAHAADLKKYTDFTAQEYKDAYPYIRSADGAPRHRSGSQKRAGASWCSYHGSPSLRTPGYRA